MALHFYHRLQTELVGCPPNSANRTWIQDKIVHYEQLLKTLGEGDLTVPEGETDDGVAQSPLGAG